MERLDRELSKKRSKEVKSATPTGENQWSAYPQEAVASPYFPALILRRRGEERGLMLVGYRPYDGLRSAVRHLDAEIEPLREPCSRDEYDAYWGGVLDWEFQELARDGITRLGSDVEAQGSHANESDAST